MSKKILFLFVIIISITGCSDVQRSPSLVFMPDMYYPVAYDPYMQSSFSYPEDENGNQVPVFERQAGMTALWPQDNTVPREENGLLPYEGKNTAADYNASKAVVESPLNPAEKAKDMERGKQLYGIYCAVCHGTSGDGKGSIVQSGAYNGAVPTYASREITVGSVYHVIMYGKNAMGSYASQLNQADRWRVAEYVMKLKNSENKGN